MRVYSPRALRRHLYKVCKIHKVEVEVTTKNGNVGFANVTLRKILIPPIRSVVSYFRALHEVGHIVDRKAHIGRKIERETNAWIWALEHAVIDPTPRVSTAISSDLSTYYFWAEENRKTKKGRLRKKQPFIPGRRHVFWKLCNPSRHYNASGLIKALFG